MDPQRTEESLLTTAMSGNRPPPLPEEPDFDNFNDSPPSTPSVRSTSSRSSMPSTISTPKKGRSATKSLRDLNGTWTLSKSLSSGIPPALEIQGFTSPVRKAIIASPLRLQIMQSHYPSQIFIKQHTTSSVPAVTLRWYPPQRPGTWSEWWESATEGTRSRCRWAKGGEVEDGGFLIEGMSRSAELLECEVECKGQGWVKREVWVVESGKRLVRRVVTLGRGRDGEWDGRRAETRLVYEFEG